MQSHTQNSDHRESNTELLKRNEELATVVENLKREVVKRKEVENTLAQERLILRTLIDNLPDAIYAKDIEGRKILANPGDVRNTRRASESEVLGKTDYDLFPRELAEHYVADDKGVLEKGEAVMWREEYVPGDKGDKRWIITTKLPMRSTDGAIIGLVGIGRDITKMKEAEHKLEAAYKDLVRASRAAGMAEVATSVLHNVGNVLNSVNVAASVILDRLNKLKINRLAELAKLLQDHKDDLPAFLASDPRGKQVAEFVNLLSKNFDEERIALRAEAEQLILKVDHIKQIVSTQQQYAKVAGVVEKIPLVEIVEDALKIHSGAYVRHDVLVTRYFDVSPTIFIDRHKVLQILGNLLSNAKYACDASPKNEKQVVVRIQSAGQDRVSISVADNGMGISPENLKRIFTQGFSTRKEGHGFGLHSCAIAAKEMGGSLKVQSDGENLGATFTLEIPTTAPAESGEKD